MRIISGRFKNKKLYFPKNLNTRPLKDNVRENIFNILKSLSPNVFKIPISLFFSLTKIINPEMMFIDATNIIIDQVLSIITPISIDHQEYLGKTIDKIVIEKLGIVKKSSTILCSKQSPKVKKQINDFARKNNNKIISY